MAAIISRMRRWVTERSEEEIRELSQAGVSLRILKSEDLDQRKQDFQRWFEYLSRRIDLSKNKPLNVLSKLERRVIRAGDVITRDCAPYLRAGDNPHHAQTLILWNKCQALMWKFIQDTKYDVEHQPFLDISAQVRRVYKFYMQQHLRAMQIIADTAFKDKDVTARYIFSVYQQVQPPVWQPSVIPTAERPLEMTPPQPRRYPPRLPPETEEKG